MGKVTYTYPTKHETHIPQNVGFRSLTLGLDIRERSQGYPTKLETKIRKANLLCLIHIFNTFMFFSRALTTGEP